MACGGEKFSYIPALNNHPLHIKCLTSLIKKHCQGWPETSPGYDAAAVGKELELQQARVEKLKD